MSDGTSILSVDHLTVQYGHVTALRDVTFALERGTVGLLGPNAAGKSTLIKSLIGFVAPASGHVEVMGLNVASSPVDARRRIGFMPENDAHIPGMSALAFVAYCGELAGLTRADALQRAHEVLQYVGLEEARYRDVSTYSTGMKQRAKLAQALVHDPDLLLLDEPTNGMDPAGREDMLSLIRDVAGKGISVLLSSHLLPDVESTCERVVMLDEGSLVANAPVRTLTARRGRVFEVRIKGDAERFLAALNAKGMDGQADVDVLRVLIPEGEGARRLFQIAVDTGVQVRHLRPSVATLDDAFAKTVGES